MNRFGGNSMETLPFLTLTPGPYRELKLNFTAHNSILQTQHLGHCVIYPLSWANFQQQWLPLNVCFRQGPLEYEMIITLGRGTENLKKKGFLAVLDFRAFGQREQHESFARAGKDLIDQHWLFKFYWHKTVRKMVLSSLWMVSRASLCQVSRIAPVIWKHRDTMACPCGSYL